MGKVWNGWFRTIKAERGGATLKSRVIDVLVRRRFGLQAFADAAIWCSALAVAAWLRLDFARSAVDEPGILLLAGVAATTQTALGWANGLYRGRWRFGSFDGVAPAAATAAAAGTAAFMVNYWWVTGHWFVPRSVPLIATVLTVVGMGSVRFSWRLVHQRRMRPPAERCQRLLVFGAGEAAGRLMQAMMHDPASTYVPVALLDDDPSKRKLRICGVSVAGTRHDICRAAATHRAGALLIAIPTATAALVSEITELAAPASLAVKVLPPMSELIDGQFGVGDIRELAPSDLVGRHIIQTDVDSVAGYLKGRRVLITGAGGSIGSELCRQIYRFAPDELIMVDRDEGGLHAVQLAIEGRALLDSPDVVLLDIRDTRGVMDLFARRRPHVVFHAAALKHLPLLERHPAEAVRTNVWGTLNVLEAASAAGVERFINISTDKAADPTSVLGHSKRAAERLTAHFGTDGTDGTGTFVSVRFGNVVGSRGSVLGAFLDQIERGGPVTVTRKDATRYLMTVEEAVQLLIQAGAIGRSGEVMVLDVGDPVRIGDLARLLVSRSRRPVQIIETGLRPGEKLHETLFGKGEVDRRPCHPLIAHVDAPPLAPSEVFGFDLLDPDVLRQQMALGGALPVPPSEAER